MHSAFGV
jgi:hypothetical protein